LARNLRLDDVSQSVVFFVDGEQTGIGYLGVLVNGDPGKRQRQQLKAETPSQPCLPNVTTMSQSKIQKSWGRPSSGRAHEALRSIPSTAKRKRKHVTHDSAVSTPEDLTWNPCLLWITPKAVFLNPDARSFLSVVGTDINGVPGVAFAFRGEPLQGSCKPLQVTRNVCKVPTM
jgi:hypothetical protein